MKKLITLLAVLFFSSIMSGSLSGDQCPSSTNDIVYITETGTKYHRIGCRYLEESCIPIARDEAKKRDLTPCKVCDP